jgi:hypothetical protein
MDTLGSAILSRVETKTPCFKYNHDSDHVVHECAFRLTVFMISKLVNSVICGRITYHFLQGVKHKQDILNQDLASLKEKINNMQHVSYDGTFV